MGKPLKKKSLPKDMFIDFRKRGRERGRGRRDINWLPPVRTVTGAGTQDPGTCPDQASKPHFRERNNAQTNCATQQGSATSLSLSCSSFGRRWCWYLRRASGVGDEITRTFLAQCPTHVLDAATLSFHFLSDSRCELPVAAVTNHMP